MCLYADSTDVGASHIQERVSFVEIPSLLSMSCQERSDQYNCSAVIEQASEEERSNFLNCNEPQRSIAVTCGQAVMQSSGSGLATAKVSQVAIQKLGAQSFGRMLGYWGLAALAAEYVVAPIANWVTKSDQECFRNEEQKKITLKSYFLYHNISEENQNTYVRWGCSKIAEAVGSVMEKMEAAAFKRDQNRNQYNEYLQDLEESFPNDPNNIKRAEIRFPIGEREIVPENEQAVIDSVSLSLQKEQAIKEETEKIIRSQPCANFMKVTEWVCSTAGMGAGFAVANRNPWEISTEFIVAAAGPVEGMLRRTKFLKGEVSRVLGGSNVNVTEAAEVAQTGLGAVKARATGQVNRVMNSLTPEYEVDVESLVDSTQAIQQGLATSSAEVGDTANSLSFDGKMNVGGVTLTEISGNQIPGVINISAGQGQRYFQITNVENTETQTGLQTRALSHQNFSQAYDIFTGSGYKIYVNPGRQNANVDQQNRTLVMPPDIQWGELTELIRQNFTVTHDL